MPRKPVADMTDEELYSEWQGGMFFECQEGLSDADQSYLTEIEREMDRRQEALPAEMFK